MEMKKGNKRGFTLAEVLITLGIIGVVAAMTIPTLIANYQKQQYVVGLKKGYSEFNQALIMLANDQGCSGDLKCTGLFPINTNNSKDFRDALVKYLKLVKICDLNDEKCYPLNMMQNQNYDGSAEPMEYIYTFGDGYSFITADGMNMNIGTSYKDCDQNFSISNTGSLTQVCSMITFDVNGNKGPNYAGRDIFAFYITNGKGPMLYPACGADDKSIGYWKDNNFCDTNHSMDYACAARIMEEGWQMKY